MHQVTFCLPHLPQLSIKSLKWCPFHTNSPSTTALIYLITFLSLLSTAHIARLFAILLHLQPGGLELQVNSDMTDSLGPGKLVRHMQIPSYAYDRLSPSYASVYVIALGTSFDIYKSQNSERICLAGLLSYMYLSAQKCQKVLSGGT